MASDSSSPATISVAMIVKNGADEIRRTLDSLPSCIHEICITDTGSDDSTVDVLEKDGRAKLSFYEDPNPIEVDGKKYLGDFAAARNYNFSQCSSDYIFWIDADDVLWNPSGFTRYYDDVISRAKDQITVFGMQYDYDHDEYGNCIFQQDRERIVRRDTHVWKSPIHEVLCSIFSYAGLKIPANESRIIHSPKNKDEKLFRAKRNLKVEEQFISRSGGSVEARMWLLHGNSLMGLQRYKEAIASYKKYLDGAQRNDVVFWIFNRHRRSVEKNGRCL